MSDTSEAVEITDIEETTTIDVTDYLIGQQSAGGKQNFSISFENLCNNVKTELNIEEEIRKNASTFRGNWTNWANVPTDYNLYPADASGNKKPDINDYLMINDASDYTGETLSGTWRFRYTGNWDTDGKNGWIKEYQVKIDMSGYVEKTTTIAGIDLQDNITTKELEVAIKKDDIEWASDITFSQGQSCVYQGFKYVSKCNNNTNNTPTRSDNQYWQCSNVCLLTTQYTFGDGTTTNDLRLLPCGFYFLTGANIKTWDASLSALKDAQYYIITVLSGNGTIFAPFSLNGQKGVKWIVIAEQLNITEVYERKFTLTNNVISDDTGWSIEGKIIKSQEFDNENYSGGYVIYSNGYCSQWYREKNVVTSYQGDFYNMNLLVPYKNTNYSCQRNMDNGTVWVWGVSAPLSTTQCRLQPWGINGTGQTPASFVYKPGYVCQGFVDLRVVL